jgi:hypothetical protein
MKVSYQDYLDAQREAAFSGRPTYSYSDYSAMIIFKKKLKKSFTSVLRTGILAPSN